MTYLPARASARRSPARPSGRTLKLGLVGLGAIALTSFGSIGGAGALLQPFSLSPTSGPPGTVVNVRGTSCSPGPAVASTQDYVKISSTTLPLSVDIPVAANGSWSGRFMVPGDAPAVPGLVAAVCVTDGLPSTITYSPQSFTVTGTATTPTTRPGTRAPTPTTGAAPGTGSATPTTRAATGAGIGTGSGNNGTGGGAASGTGSAGRPTNANAGSGIGSAPNGNAGGAANAAAVASGAKRPALAASGTTTTTHHSAWLWWLILAIILVAIVASAISWRRRSVADRNLT